MIARDRAPALWHMPPRTPPHRHLALDRASVRSYSIDGHLHIADAMLSKAEVSFYVGIEVPDHEKLGLDPDQKYPLLRPPDELRKAAPTFRMLPVLWGHQPLDAANHPSDLVIGAVGSDVEFTDPVLRGSHALRGGRLPVTQRIGSQSKVCYR